MELFLSFGAKSGIHLIVSFIFSLRVSLISPSKEVRAAGFRAFRHLLTDEENMNAFLEQRIDIFIMK